MNLLIRFVIRKAGWIAALGSILSVVGGYYTFLLYKNLRTDIEELLPTSARSVMDLNEVTRRLESTENLAIITLSENTKASRRFVDNLAAKLQEYPKDIIAGVEYRIDKEIHFFESRRALYLDLADLEKIRTFIRDRIEYEKLLYNPLTIFQNVDIPEPALDVRSLETKYSNRISSYTRFPDGYYATEDEKVRVLLVHLPGKLSGINGSKALRAAVDSAIAELNPKSYSEDLQIKFTGGVQNLIEEHESLIADLGFATLVVIVMVTLVLVLYYRSKRATAILILSLLMGTLWTFGISYFLVGYLNANSAFLGSVVIGNGINFGIILLARFLEERRRKRENVRAVYLSLLRTYKATLTAALAAGLAYGSLTLTGFRGFKQFGLIGLVGMVLCWISAYTVLPAFLVLLERFSSLKVSLQKSPKRVFSSLVAGFIQRHFRSAWTISFLLTLGSLAAFIQYDGQILETDLSKLRDKTSIESGSAYLSKYVDQVFDRYLSPVVILPKDREDTPKIVAHLRKKKDQEGKNSLISAVYSIDDFIPKNQPQKFQKIREIRQLLSPTVMRALSPQDRMRVREFFTPEVLKPVTVEDLPPLILSKFTERDGTIGKLVLVEPPLTKELWDGNNLINWVASLRESSDRAEPGTAVAGQLPVTSDMIEAITKDGPKATLFAFLAVVILAIFLFKNTGTVVLVCFALLLGVTWLAGLIFGLDLKINFLNFIALPITFGIGVDYGVNIFQRYRMEGQGNILKVIEQTGGAIGLASLTTIIGFGSLLLAGNQAFVSFGRLAVLGEITCVFAALISLPAYLCYRDRREQKTVLRRQTRHTVKKMGSLPAWTRLVRYRTKIWVSRWPRWWKDLSFTQKLGPFLIVLFYWLTLWFLNGFRGDHFTIGAVFLVLCYGGSPFRAALKFLLPVLLTGVVYDSQRFYSDYIRGEIRVKEPYLFDKNFFGISHSNSVLTPNEWLQLHIHPALDLVTGFAYLVFIAVFVLCALYFTVWLGHTGTKKKSAREIRIRSPRVMWSFFWVNVLGYSTYYWYPAAPPWYVDRYGLGPARLDTPADPAGCLRFDELLGTNFFTEMYGRSADVFGAIPSLHVAYPLLTVYYAFQFGALRGFSLFFYILMCFSAVYLNHHYILDLIWGSCYALFIAVLMDWIGKKETRHLPSQELSLTT